MCWLGLEKYKDNKSDLTDAYFYCFVCLFVLKYHPPTHPPKKKTRKNMFLTIFTIKGLLRTGCVQMKKVYTTKPNI